MTGEHDTITLKDAAQHFGFTVSTLRAEAGRGRLTLYKIGKRLYTTPADIKNMVQQCRVEQKVQDFTLIRNDANGPSETERASSAQARAREIATRLKSISRNTSPANTSRNLRARQ